MKSIMILLLLFMMSCQSKRQKEAQQRMDAVKDMMEENYEAAEKMQKDQEQQHFSVQVMDNGKTYASLENGDANGTITAGGIQLTLNGQTHSIYISIPGKETKTYSIGGSDGGSFLFNSGDDKEQMMLFGMQGTVTITSISDTKFSGHFSGTKNGSNSTLKLKGEFKDIPVEDFQKLMKDAGL